MINHVKMRISGPFNTTAPRCSNRQ